MRYFAWCFIFCCSLSWAQVLYDKPTVEVNGDAEVKVVPDRVSIRLASRPATPVSKPPRPARTQR